MALPPNLPVPKDDGAADHLQGMNMPAVALPSSLGRQVALDRLRGTLVLYVFPMIGRPDRPLPNGWDEKPGARGCTVQSLAYSQALRELTDLGIQAFGVSVQGPAEQRDAVDRLGLRQPLLSDQAGALREALELPTFELEGKTFLRRLTIVVASGTIERVWYPVFPPGRDVEEVRRWAKA
jgi:peroxiredoxin